MGQREATRRARELGPGGHVQAVYDDRRDHRSFLEAYVGDGLRQGDRVVVMADTAAARRMASEGRSTATRGLTVYGGGSDLLGSGGFEPRGILDSFGREQEQARAEGFRSFRVMGDMTWVWRAGGTAEDLVEFEHTLDDELGRRDDVLIACLFDRRRFPVEVLDRVTRAHGQVADLDRRGRQGPGWFRIFPSEPGGSLVVEGELDLATEDAAAEAVALASTRRGRGGVEVDVGALSFTSVHGLRLLCSPAIEGGEVTLLRPSPLVREMVELLGFADLPGLHLSPPDGTATGQPGASAEVGGGAT